MKFIKDYWSQFLIICAVISFGFKFFYDVRDLKKSVKAIKVNVEDSQDRIDNIIDEENKFKTAYEIDKIKLFYRLKELENKGK